MKISEMKKGSWGKIVAFFDIETQEGFIMKGFKIVDTGNGMFIGFPSAKGGDQEYRDTIWADKDLKDQVKEIALTEYQNPTEYQNAAVNEDEEIPF